MLEYLVRYKFTILLSGFIALISLLPSSSMPDTSLFSISFLDKIVHFGMYSLLGFVALLETGCPTPCLRIHVILLFAIFLLSTLIEILQATVVATRSAEWLDLAANFTGLAAGYTGYRILRIIRS